MKAVMISMQPKWCELIASGKKTIEVRKTRPKIDVPFKCYIYAIKSKRDGIGHIVSYSFRSGISFDVGKIIGEFVCNKILDVPSYVGSYEDCQDYEISDDDLEKTCIGLGDLFNYGRGKALYGWHISDLKIYDKPKELREFWKANTCKYYDGGCDCWSELCKIAQSNDCHCGYTRITRPPQSWCYVEGLK